MLARFSLYGFLKNLRFFEPFLILFFLENGLSFTEIGILIPVRTLLLNVFEIPSGAFADIYGRKTSLMFSLSMYIISFLIFYVSHSFLFFALAMTFSAFGDAFRTGTHKAIIFSWLRENNRINEKTKIYGYTRSWSKLGSATSVIIGLLILLLIENNYRILFLFVLVPYVLGLINISFYPSYLNKKREYKFGIKTVYKHFINSLRKSIETKALRELIFESMNYEGNFGAIKDYIQPIIKTGIITSLFVKGISLNNKNEIAISSVYFILFILSAFASRKADLIKSIFGDEEKTSNKLWLITFVSFVIMFVGFVLNNLFIVILTFLFIYTLQNIWRPVQISRFESFATEEDSATILSIESQSKAIATAIYAPLYGVMIDMLDMYADLNKFIPIALMGIIISSYFYVKKLRVSR